MFGCLGETSLSNSPSYSDTQAYAEPAMPDYDYTGSSTSSIKYVTQESSISVKVPEGSLDSKFDELKQMLLDNGALVSNINYNEFSKTKEYTISVKVPPKKFDNINQRIKDLGDVTDISVELEDVTKQYIDLDTRIQNREIELQRLYDLYNASDDISDLLAIEYELSRIETELDILKGEKQYLISKVEYSDISIRMYEEKPSTQQLFLSLEDVGTAFFGALGFGITLLVIVVGFLLPLGVLVAIVWFIYKKVKPSKVVGPSKRDPKLRKSSPSQIPPPQ